MKRLFREAGALTWLAAGAVLCAVIVSVGHRGPRRRFRSRTVARRCRRRRRCSPPGHHRGHRQLELLQSNARSWASFLQDTSVSAFNGVSVIVPWSASHMRPPPQCTVSTRAMSSRASRAIWFCSNSSSGQTSCSSYPRASLPCWQQPTCFPETGCLRSLLSRRHRSSFSWRRISRSLSDLS